MAKPREKDKFKKACWYLQHYYGKTEIARLLGVDRVTVYRWAKRLEREVYTAETGKLELRALHAILKRFRGLNPVSRKWLLQKLKVEEKEKEKDD